MIMNIGLSTLTSIQLRLGILIVGEAYGHVEAGGIWKQFVSSVGFSCDLKNLKMPQNKVYQINIYKVHINKKL